MDGNKNVESIYRAILEGDSSNISVLIEKTLDEGEEPLRIINEVLNPAIKEVGDKFNTGDMYLPELILSAEVMEAAVAILKPAIEARKEKLDVPGRVVMATVQGDIHDIGKNITCALLRANGFEVLDLGRDIPAAQIVAKALEFKADIIGLSALLSTTLPYCRDTVNLLKEMGLSDKYKVFIGGGSVTPEYAEDIGAEYGGPHAEAGVARMLKSMERV